MTRCVSLVVAVLLLSTQASGQHFSDVSGQTGAAFQHIDSPVTNWMSGGMAWFDMDGDGDDDLFLASSDTAHKLLRNDRGVFTDLSAGSGITGNAVNTVGVAAGDYDQDGYPDLYLTNFNENRLYRNNAGDGTFTDVTDLVGIGGGSAWSTSAMWGDWDRDGDLDLYVGNYIDEIDFPYHIGEPNRFWVNEGTPQAPEFVDRAPELGLDLLTRFGPPHPSYPSNPHLDEMTAATTLSLNATDYDDDGDQDLFVGNDFGMFITPSKLFRNDTLPGGELRFTDVSVQTHLHDYPQFNMGIEAADYDLDGDWDLYLSDMGPNKLLRNDHGVFVDATAISGPVGQMISTAVTSWAALWEDFDNDGFQDLYVVNGYIEAAFPNKLAAKNRMYINQGDGTFAYLGGSGLEDTGLGRSAGHADYDADGMLDIYLMNNGSPLQIPIAPCALFRNNGTIGDPTNHWLQLRLRGERSNTEALGALVDVWVGNVVLKRQVKSRMPFLSSPTRVLHVGLGPLQRADRIEFRWPSGTYQEWHDVAVDATREVREPRVVIHGTQMASTERGSPQLVVEARNLHHAEVGFATRVVLKNVAGQTITRTVDARCDAGDTMRITVPIAAGLQPLASWRVEVRDHETQALDVRVGGV
jgi:hypothetical protein